MIKNIILFISLSLAIASCNLSPSDGDAVLDSEEIVYVPKTEYGIIVDSLFVVKEKVKKNEFLSDILLKYGVSYSTIDHLARFTRDTFDVRKIRVGNNYTVICDNDSSRRAHYFAYEINPYRYVLYNFKDNLEVTKGVKEIKIELDTISGEITTSLWNSIAGAGGDPNMANNLSEIYAWTIDFFGLQKGDRYKVYFEKQFVDGKYIELGKIIAANFYHGGDNNYAFYFEQNNQGDYFDEKGNSLQRTFLKAPLRFSRISSGFSNSRLHPVLKIRRPHHGVDYAAPSGTPVHSVGEGIIVKKGYQKRGGGNYLSIKHNGTYSTTYMHLKGYAKGIKVGKKVKQGDLIGYVGKTGLATGPHLDFRFYRNGKAINPLKVESPPSKPIDSAYITQFDSTVLQYRKFLD
ncbi:MAG: metalloendopeptidase [Marinilabiliales bacterium]|nr:MAG: metalloendopeptidase [Marinilabiliales bacterium]